MTASAYLIVICDKETNAIKEVTIWSSPEWEQSMCLPDPTFVAFCVPGVAYHESRQRLLNQIANPRSRYHWLFKKMDGK